VIGTFIEHETKENVMKTLVQKLIKEQRGGEFIEYIIIAGVVALLAVTAFTTFGSDVQGKITEEGSKVSAIQD
jgi:pilus assembly protein Flp/PilA